MNYIVAYKLASEIFTGYHVIDFFIDDKFLYECILIEGNSRTAQFIKTGMPEMSIELQPLLQRTVRCYIINTNDIPWDLTISEILDRYR